MTTWLVILGMALVTFATRFVAFVAIRGDIAPWLQRWLSYVPIAVFVALLLPPLITEQADTTTMLSLGPALPVGIVGAIVAWYSRNVLLTITLGLFTFWLIQLITH
ncbi:MAG: AzlD domain-containing protein [Chloroflexota bacterium]